MPFSLPEDFEPHHSAALVDADIGNTLELNRRVAELFGIPVASVSSPYTALNNALSHLPEARDEQIAALKKIAADSIRRTRENAEALAETAIQRLGDNPKSSSKNHHQTSLRAVEIFAVCIKGALDEQGISAAAAVRAPIDKSLRALEPYLNKELYALLHQENLRDPDKKFRKLAKEVLFAGHIGEKLPEPSAKSVKNPSQNGRVLNLAAQGLNKAYNTFGAAISREQAYHIFCEALEVKPENRDPHHRVGRLLHEHTKKSLKDHIDHFQETGITGLSRKEIDNLAIREKGRFVTLSSKLVERICVDIINQRTPKLTFEAQHETLQTIRQKLLGASRAPGE